MPNNQPLRAHELAADAWDPSHTEVEVGILIFDIEHREMLDRLRRLYLGIAHGEPEARVRRALTGLLDVSKKHFDHEEDYMKTLEYADYRQHTDDHLALTASLESFVGELFAHGASTDRNLAHIGDFFRKWLLDHVLEHDRSLANFLAQKGLR